MKTSFQYVDAVKTAMVFINATSAYELRMNICDKSCRNGKCNNS